MAAARTRPEHPNRAATVGERPEGPPRPADIADDLVVRDAPRRPDLRRDILRTPMALPGVEIRADGDVAVMGELSRGFPVPLIPAGQMMNQHHTRKGPGAQGSGQVDGDPIPLGAWDHARLSQHAFVHVRLIH